MATRFRPLRLATYSCASAARSHSATDWSGARVATPTETVTVSGPNSESVAAAVGTIEAMTEEIKVGRVYMGTVSSVKDFGAFIEIAPGKDGLCHISELSSGFVKNVTTGDRLNDDDGWGGRIGLRAELTDSLRWVASYARIDHDGENILNFECNPANPSDCDGRFVTTGLREGSTASISPYAPLVISGRKANYLMGNRTSTDDPSTASFRKSSFGNLLRCNGSCRAWGNSSSK